MKEIVVISGKGGTGKTSLVASLAVLAGKVVLADCDVDAADLHLVLAPQVKSVSGFTGGKKANILADRCNGCGKCFEVCRFGAVVRQEGRRPVYLIDPIACEGCGVCSYFCPEKAVEFKPALNGQWYISDTRCGPMVHARLGVAEENSGKLVTLVRNQARMIAEEEGLPYIIVDGPPGIGCPVIATITGADAALVVTEPTVSGEHDLARVAELAGHFKVPVYLCINKYDINPAMAKKMEEDALSRGIRLAGKIRYDRSVTGAQLSGAAVVEFSGGPVAGDIRNMWKELVKYLNTSEER
ncbi:MAG: ATP-binding protein [Armatimonadetes bacterium]|nr:ATP-binding protein [Armatimonadota bacterium]